MISFPFPRRFAVFRGPSFPSAGLEWADSLVVFDATPCETVTDGTFYAATPRPWVSGAFLTNEDPIEPDTNVYDVKIHIPSQSDVPYDHRYMYTPYTVSKHHGNSGLFAFVIPVLMFQDMSWMPEIDSPVIRHTLNCHEPSKLHIRHNLFLAFERMREHPAITRFLDTNKNLYDMTHPQYYDAPDRTKEHWITHWYMQLLNTTMEPRNVSALAEAAPLPDDDDEIDDATQDGPFAPLGWSSGPSQWPVFVYQNHVQVERSKGTECPITMMPLTDMPNVAVNPTCGHIFEPAALTNWITTCREKGELPLCPTCRIAIPNGAMLIQMS
jgi:hypothetical protein